MQIEKLVGGIILSTFLTITPPALASKRNPLPNLLESSPEVASMAQLFVQKYESVSPDERSSFLKNGLEVIRGQFFKHKKTSVESLIDLEGDNTLVQNFYLNSPDQVNKIRTMLQTPSLRKEHKEHILSIIQQNAVVAAAVNRGVQLKHRFYSKKKLLGEINFDFSWQNAILKQ